MNTRCKKRIALVVSLLSTMSLVSCQKKYDNSIMSSINYLNESGTYFCLYKNYDESFSGIKNYSTYANNEFDFSKIKFFYLSINVKEDLQYLTKNEVNRIHGLLNNNTYVFISFYNAGDAEFLQDTDFDNGKHLFNTSNTSVNVWRNSGKATTSIGGYFGYNPSPVDYESHDYYVFSVLTCCEQLVKEVRGSM